MEVPPKTYLQSSAVRARFGVSDMTIWRWLHNNELGFPAPLRINGRRFWRLAELEAWEASRSGEGKTSLKEAPAEGERKLTTRDAA
jgi:predicted DNA-binding transcriptional regulator AlpA